MPPPRVFWIDLRSVDLLLDRLGPTYDRGYSGIIFLVQHPRLILLQLLLHVTQTIQDGRGCPLLICSMGFEFFEALCGVGYLLA
jgi:hypothetical protein